MNKKFSDTIKEIFKNKYGVEPVLVFSPGRINLIGEHVDYNDGYVFPAAVDKGIVAGIAKSNKSISTAFAIDLNETCEFSLDTLKPMPEGSWQNYIIGVVAELKKANKTIGGFNFAFSGNIPSGAGMSSSAALENSVVYGLNEVFKLGLSKYEMILISQKAEHNFVGVKCGIMDQYASMFGQEDTALLLDCRSVEAQPFKIDFKEYELLLVNTNVSHSLSNSAYNDRRKVCESVAKMLNLPALRDATEADLETVKHKIAPEDYKKALYIVQEIARVVKASKSIRQDDLEGLGSLMYASHNGLRNQYKVSCEELDFLVEQAKLDKNILGARMMGGGFGGCTINLIAKSATTNFKSKISKAYKDKFNTDCSIYEVKLSQGTHVVE